MASDSGKQTTLVVTEQDAKMHASQPKTFREIIPWTGIASLVGMVLCAIASAVVVGVSNNKLADSWSIQPAVILAILSAVSNIAFNSAMATGIAVRFWLYASRNTQLSQLHYIWDHGRGLGFISALRAGSEARTVAVLATIAYITQFASGPLLQRSVNQDVKMYESSQDLLMDVVPRIPDGWLGTMENDEVIGFLNGIPQLQAVWRNVSMQTKQEPGYMCNGTCHGYVKGAGFAHRCSDRTEYLDMATTLTDNATVFEINATRAVNSANKPYLLLTHLYASDVNNSCIATLTVRTCEVDAAVVEYPVTITNSTITLRADELTSMRVISTYTSPLDLPGQETGTNSGPLSGLQSLTGNFGDRLYNHATKRYNPDSKRTRFMGETSIAENFILTQSPAYADPDGPMRKCALTWASPTEYVLRYMHEFMFRSALRIGTEGIDMVVTTSTSPKFNTTPPYWYSPDPAARQTIRTTKQTPLPVFTIDPSYLGAGIATMVLALTLVASLMWGWWRLRRSVTLSPIETVSALVDAPELRDMTPDTTLKQILSKVETAAAASGSNVSVRSEESAPAGYGLRKTVTSRSIASSSAASGLGGFRPRPVARAMTFGGGTAGTEMGTDNGGSGWFERHKVGDNFQEIRPVRVERTSSFPLDAEHVDGGGIATVGEHHGHAGKTGEGVPSSK